MSKKSFWNRIGLPCLDDIQELKDASRKQEEALSSLIALNRDTIELLKRTENSLSVAVEGSSNNNQKAITAAVETICEAMLKYYEGSSQLLMKQSGNLSASLESLDTLHTGVKELQQTSAKQEEISAAIVNLKNDLMCLLRETKSELSASIDKTSVECKETVDFAAAKARDIMQKLSDSEIQLLTDQECKLAENIETINAFRGEFQRASKEDREEFGQLLAECKSQEELLRILTANSLLNDASKLLSKELSSSPRSV